MPVLFFEVKSDQIFEDAASEIIEAIRKLKTGVETICTYNRMHVAEWVKLQSDIIQDGALLDSTAQENGYNTAVEAIGTVDAAFAAAESIYSSAGYSDLSAGLPVWP